MIDSSENIVSSWLKRCAGAVRGNSSAKRDLRLLTLETKVDLQWSLILRLIDLVHERDAMREKQDKELHLFVQQLSHRTGVTLRVHRDDIRKLVALVTGKPTEELIDMKATNVWKPKL